MSALKEIADRMRHSVELGSASYRKVGLEEIHPLPLEEKKEPVVQEPATLPIILPPDPVFFASSDTCRSCIFSYSGTSRPLRWALNDPKIVIYVENYVCKWSRHLLMYILRFLTF